MEKNPHLLIEGMILAAYAIQAQHRLHLPARRVRVHPDASSTGRSPRRAPGRPARRADVAGQRLRASSSTPISAPAPTSAARRRRCSRSLEGYRGQPRLKPPFPAVEGLYACPTVVNNTETLMNVPHILKNGAQWFRQWGTEKSPGTKILSVSGPVKRPGNYEVPMGLPLSTLIERALRRDARRNEDQGGDPGRLVGAAAAGLDARHRPRLRVDGRGRHAARLGRRDRDRRPDLHRRRALEHHPLLRARVVRQVHAVPRGHLLDERGVRAARERARPRAATSTCSPTSRTTSSASRSARSATPRRCR